jgi:2-dehydro-3-deoxy-D-arabinonate dehydratase
VSSDTQALFRVELPGGERRLARGGVESGPRDLLHDSLTLDGLLAAGGLGLRAALDSADGRAVPAGARVVTPVESQEIWAAGVTYRLSRDARMDESDAAADCYRRVYDAPRPELFFKAPGWRARGEGQAIRVRGDSSWDVPEPELTLVLDSTGAIVGYTIGNDVSSRSIEGENPLYLPQAKSYDGACAVGPALVPATDVEPPFVIEMTIARDGATVFAGETTTTEMRRGLGELAGYLFRELSFPFGALLMTGTSLVPDPPLTLARGDEVAIGIAGLGRLTNRVAGTDGDADVKEARA